jgi:hypothetical protein
MKRSSIKSTTQTIDASTRSYSAVLGVDGRALGSAVKRRPSLRSKLEALAENAAVCARILGVRDSEFVRLALVEPGLIGVSPPALLMLLSNRCSNRC